MQVANTRPQVDYQDLVDAPSPLNLDNLNQLEGLGAWKVHLTSKDNVVQDPGWLHGIAPDDQGRTKDVISCSIIVVDHGDGMIDAFYFYFFAFNQGLRIFGWDVGDHVGDWEHNMIRFFGGVPYAVWASDPSHILREVLTRPTVLRGKLPPRLMVKTPIDGYVRAHNIVGGPHYNFGLIQDHTDQGKLWDPILTSYHHIYSKSDKTFTPADGVGPTNWLYFTGHWGDQTYLNDDSRQTRALAIDSLKKYVEGPTGPIEKHLIRDEPCLLSGDYKNCEVLGALSKQPSGPASNTAAQSSPATLTNSPPKENIQTQSPAKSPDTFPELTTNDQLEQAQPVVHPLALSQAKNSLEKIWSSTSRSLNKEDDRSSTLSRLDTQVHSKTAVRVFVQAGDGCGFDKLWRLDKDLWEFELDELFKVAGKMVLNGRPAKMLRVQFLDSIPKVQYDFERPDLDDFSWVMDSFKSDMERKRKASADVSKPTFVRVQVRAFKGDDDKYRDDFVDMLSDTGGPFIGDQKPG
ncbi:MAG: hypothetical protein M1833_003128 [Piccolia ochrophora]|nr:MAG: hypothetical protein M1833_003128 [Piccolia ochrophora]